jgi:hypothetical protein
MNKKIINKNDFDWKFYVNKYPDLKHIKNENDAYKHYLLYGKNENRIPCNKRFITEFITDMKFEGIPLKEYNANKIKIDTVNKIFFINNKMYYY